jgi:hypothetical protein
MSRHWTTLLAAVVAFVPMAAQNVPQSERLLARRYVDGERLQYLMKGQDDGTTYEARLTATTTKNAEGRVVEEFAWSNLIMGDSARPLSPTAQQFRLAVTLEGGMPFVLPDLSKAQGLIGPVTDLMTFYADLFVAMHQGTLRRAGDHFLFHNPVTASWADGRVVVIGEDAVDFDITLREVDTRNGVAVLVIKHIPPTEPTIRLVADWMRTPAADTPNNWVMVTKTPNGYVASVGKETFDVELRVALADGRILSAMMDNPVTRLTRDCSDAALTQCGQARRNPVFRRIEMSLLRE